jgi:hypothetical protein
MANVKTNKPKEFTMKENEIKKPEEEPKEKVEETVEELDNKKLDDVSGGVSFPKIPNRIPM